MTISKDFAEVEQKYLFNPLFLAEQGQIRRIASGLAHGSATPPQRTSILLIHPGSLRQPKLAYGIKRQQKRPCPIIVRNVQNVIRFMVRKMPLQNGNLPVKGLNQSRVSCQEMKCANATTIHASDTISHLVMSISGCKHGPLPSRPLSSLQFLLAFAKNFAILIFHSKSPPSGSAMFGCNAFYPMKTGGSSFFGFKLKNHT